MVMHSDEQKIRQLVATWMIATKAGDTQTVLDLMTDDAVFLQPGQPVMRKADFAAAAQQQSGADAPLIDGHSDIQELQVSGDWAFMWSKLEVVITPRNQTPAMTRAGHTLTVFQKVSGQWKLARDANLLAPVAAKA
jgi:uncharacterized protein (TIGR02246 family)